MKSTYLSHLALLSANIMYGLNFNIAKALMPDLIQPFGFIFCRVLGALLLFWMFGFFIKGSKIEAEDLPRLIACGLFGVAMNQLMFFYGLNITSPINSSVIMTSTPILVLLFASFLIKERITYLKILGILLGISGAIGLIVFQASDSLIASPKGDLFIFLNASSYAVYLVLVKPLLAKYSPLTVIKWVFTFGFIFVIPFGYNEFAEIQWDSFTSFSWWSFIYVIIGISFLAYLFNIYALKKLKPSAVSVYIYLQPLTATVASMFMGTNDLNAFKVLCALLIFLGVFMVSNPQLIRKVI